MNYSEKVNQKNYLYILRRTLPLWSWRENLDELVEYCREFQIDEVCVKIDTGTFTHYFPDFEWLKNYQKILKTIKKELNEIGVEYSLNPNVTQGHGDRGRNIHKQHPDWHMITGADGAECTDCVCNASPGWRKYFARQWTLYAETKPSTIWIEDDARTFNHGSVKAGCFCEEHIRRFNELYGKDMTREEIYQQLTLPGKPTETRRQWLQLLGKLSCEMVELAEKTVHAVSPETIVGLMSSGPERHTMEGRNWQEIERKIAGPNKKPVLVRPPLGNYREHNLVPLINTADMPRLVQCAFGHPTIKEGEIESYPYSTYSKSNKFLYLQNSVAMAGGCNALTLNLFDHCGTPMAVNRDIMEALRAMKPFLSGIKEKRMPGGKYQGVRLYFNPQVGEVCELEAGQNQMNFSSDVLAWRTVLQSLGFSVTFEDAAVTALAGQDIRAASAAEIKAILSKAVLLDSVAFKTLWEMGYAEYLGGTLESSLKLGTTLPLAGEHFYNTEFGGRKNHYFSLAVHKNLPLFTNIRQSADAIEISEIVDPDTKRLFGGAYLYKNSLGGKIAVCPFELGKMSEGFLDPTRKKMLYSMLNWISDHKIPLFLQGERQVLPLRYDGENDSMLAFFNLSHDMLEDIFAEMYLGDREVKNAQYLTHDGKWLDFKNLQSTSEKLKIKITRLMFDQPLFLSIHFKE
ncbi:MAG: hypothetical protein WCS73_02440 [Lentisphaeria bacterium]